jgi:hypothetical protein
MANLHVPLVQRDTCIQILCLHIGKNVKRTLVMKVRIISIVCIDVPVDLDDENEIIKQLKYDGEYNLAVCVDCGHGLPLEWIGKHFKDIHKLAVHSIIGICKHVTFQVFSHISG